MSDSANNRKIIDRSGLLTLAVIFVAGLAAINLLPPTLQLDLTEDRLYTLSEETFSVLNAIDEPVTLTLYFSDQESAALPGLRSYAARVRDMLKRFSIAADGQLEIRFIDPLPFTDAEDEAAAYGLETISMGAADRVYFGISGVNAADDLEVISFLDPTRDAFLEYDLASLVYRLSSMSGADRPLIGLLGALAIEGGADRQLGVINPPLAVYTALTELFRVQRLADDVTNISADFDALMILQPGAMNEATQLAVEQYLFAGGKALILIDPLTETYDSSAFPLLEAYGVSMSEAVILDYKYGLRIDAGNGELINFAAIPGLRDDALNSKDPATANLQSINLGYAGELQLSEDSVLTMTPLLTSSAETALLPAGNTNLLQNPQSLMSYSGEQRNRVLAMRLSGSPATAFPDTAALQRPVRPLQLVVVADTDLLNDRYWIQNGTAVFANNGDFVVNLVDDMTAGSALTGMRGRGTFNRPFSRLDDMRRETQARMSQAEEQIRVELMQTEQRLDQLQAQNDGMSGKTSAAAEAEISRYIEERLRLRRELRQVRRAFDKELDTLNTRLKFINIGMMPILITALAIATAFLRRRRQ